MLGHLVRSGFDLKAARRAFGAWSRPGASASRDGGEHGGNKAPITIVGVLTCSAWSALSTNIFVHICMYLSRSRIVNSHLAYFALLVLQRRARPVSAPAADGGGIRGGGVAWGL